MATVNHVAAIVSDLESAIRNLTDAFGFTSESIQEIRQLGVRVAFLEGQNIRIELIQPISAGPYLQYLRKGELGFNHIAIEVDSINRTIEKLKKIGIEPSGQIISGSKGNIQNLDPKTTCNLRLQIIEKN
jgi:methylmalonyl-CoA/ethylmalonyl-CoA epimerase